MDTFILDSKSIMAASKENNSKNPNRNTTNKKNAKKKSDRHAKLLFIPANKWSKKISFSFGDIEPM